YDLNGNRTQVVMPNGAIHFLAYTPADLDAGYTPPGNGSYTTTYDTDRRPLRSTWPSGRILNRGYDNGGRLTSVNYADATVAVLYPLADPTHRISSITPTPTADRPPHHKPLASHAPPPP